MVCLSDYSKNTYESNGESDIISVSEDTNMSGCTDSNITENFNRQRAEREEKGYYISTAGNYVGADNERIELVNYYNATDKTYQEVLNFLKTDKTDRKEYTDNFQCGDFAELVHNNAEATGIKCAWVAIDFIDDSDSHACNAFNTIDKGLIFIDCVNGDSNVNIENTEKYTPKSLFTAGVQYECLGLVKHKDIYW